MKVLLRYSPLIVILVALLFVNVAYAQPVLGHIEGTVTEAGSGDPVPLFPLQFKKTDAPFKDTTAVVVTDTNGVFRVPVIEGTYEITPVDVSFYQPFSITDIAVQAGQTVTKNITVTARPPDATITGNVALRGEGVEGVEVFLQRIWDFGTGTDLAKDGGSQRVEGVDATYSAVTDANGDFSIEVVHGNYILYIPGTDQYLPYLSSELFVDVGETLTLQINLKVIWTISGTVSNFAMFDKVMVGAKSVAGMGVAPFTPIDPNTGEYSLTVFEGEYIVACTGILEGHAYTIFYDDVTNPYDATILMVDKDVAGIDFMFPQDLTLSTFTITGNVSDEDTGAPLEGAKVGFIDSEIMPNHGQKHHNWVFTDADGNYSYSAQSFLDPVVLLGYAETEGYFVEFYQEEPTILTADPIEVPAGQTLSGIDFTLTEIPEEPTYDISGRVLNEDGNPPEAGVVIAYSTVGYRSVGTDADGFYTIEGFPEGTNVVLQAWGWPDHIPVFYDGVFSYLDATVLVMNEDKTNIDFTLPLKDDPGSNVGQIAGQVKANGQGPGLSGATVLVRRTTETNWHSADYSDFNGQYSLPVDGYGTYEIMVTAEGYNDVSTEVEVTETSGLSVEGADIVMTPTSIGPQSGAQLIEKHQLHAAYPNPFNPQTVIQVDIATKDRISLVVYNAIGQKIKTLYEGELNTGTQRFFWDGTDEAGRSVASGLYFYQLKSENNVHTRSVIFMK